MSFVVVLVSVGSPAVAQEDPLVSDALRVGLALPPSAIWVDLDPGRPDRVIDPQLARTDTGRVLLETDIVMKRATAKLMHPGSDTGKVLWDSLRGTCSSYRNSIVLAPASPGVRLAPDCALPADIAAHDQRVLDTVIVPRVQHAVDTAPEYADLRRVHRGLAEAERVRHRQGARLPVASGAWDPRDVHARYLRSYEDGEFGFDRAGEKVTFVVLGHVGVLS